MHYQCVAKLVGFGCQFVSPIYDTEIVDFVIRGLSLL